MTRRRAINGAFAPIKLLLSAGCRAARWAMVVLVAWLLLGSQTPMVGVWTWREHVVALTMNRGVLSAKHVRFWSPVVDATLEASTVLPGNSLPQLCVYGRPGSLFSTSSSGPWPGRGGFAYFSYTDDLTILPRWGYREFSIVRWLFALVVCVPALAPEALAAARWLRRRRCRIAGLCPACGYDLRATPSQCPECGRISVDSVG